MKRNCNQKNSSLVNYINDSIEKRFPEKNILKEKYHCVANLLSKWTPHYFS